jgi:hypothetical protein
VLLEQHQIGNGAGVSACRRRRIGRAAAGDPGADQVQPAGPVLDAVQPPGDPGASVAGDITGLVGGALQVVPDRDVESGGRSAEFLDAGAERHDVVRLRPAVRPAGVNRHDTVPAGGTLDRPPRRQHRRRPDRDPGRCTGAGTNRTGPTAKCCPRCEKRSPLHSPARTASPSSSSSARCRACVGSPNSPNSACGGEPIPAPKITRPALSRSSVISSRASFHGRRRGTGVIIVPILIRCVRTATSASTCQGSTTGGPASVSSKTRWSQRKYPSNPARSALAPSSASSAGSSAKHGTARP